MQDAPKVVWRIPYVSVVFFPSLKQNFIAYCSSKVSDCIFEIQQLWQSGFSRVYSSCCCSCSFEPEIIKISQSSHKMYSNSIVNSQESTTILNACTKKSGNLLNASYKYIYIYIYSFTTMILTKRVEKKLDGNYTKLQHTVLKNPCSNTLPQNNSCTAIYLPSHKLSKRNKIYGRLLKRQRGFY